MLRIIDQRWREHLYDMDYLKEGIHLRAMGQKDPLTEWQREGFDMFGQMMKETARDYVRTVMHVSLQPEPGFVAQKAGRRGGGGGVSGGRASAAGTSQNGHQPEGAELVGLQESAPDLSESSLASPPELAQVGAAARTSASQAAAAMPADGPRVIEEQEGTYRKSEWDSTPRNAPCPCGSGRKFKQCHGR